MIVMAPSLDRDRIATLLERMRGRRVAIVGDVMLDRYLVGDTDRLSPEAPVPVVSIRQSRLTLGGAANVAANVAALDAVGLLAGVVGEDTHGRDVLDRIAESGLDSQYMVELAGRPTTTKTRVIARGQQVVRIDEETDEPLTPADRGRLLAMVEALVPTSEVLVLEDYNKGVLDPEIIRKAIQLASARRIPIVVDPKFRHFFDYRGATVFKPNRKEMEAAFGASLDLEHDPAALEQARVRLEAEHLLLTMGAEGMRLVSAGGAIVQIPSRARDVYDVSGAGDTVTAWVATALAAGSSVGEAAFLANYAAGIEVGKAGVATVAPREVLMAYDQEHDTIGRLRRGGVL